jgi:hypothetical protein
VFVDPEERVGSEADVTIDPVPVVVAARATPVPLDEQDTNAARIAKRPATRSTGPLSHPDCLPTCHPAALSRASLIERTFRLVPRSGFR